MDKILFGLYNKHSENNEKECLEGCECPPNTLSLRLTPDEFVEYVEVKRNQFPMENTYHGWYALVPNGLKIINILENNTSPIQPMNVKMKDVKITVDGVEYDVYAHFGVAKTSNNWKLKLIFRK